MLVSNAHALYLFSSPSSGIRLEEVLDSYSTFRRGKAKEMTRRGLMTFLASTRRTEQTKKCVLEITSPAQTYNLTTPFFPFLKAHTHGPHDLLIMPAYKAISTPHIHIRSCHCSSQCIESREDWVSDDKFLVRLHEARSIAQGSMHAAQLHMAWLQMAACSDPSWPWQCLQCLAEKVGIHVCTIACTVGVGLALSEDPHHIACLMLV